MNLENVSFYNLGALEPVPGHGDWGLSRIPARVRNQMNQGARMRGMEAVGIEIRFVTDAPVIDLYMSALQPEFLDCARVRVFKGNYQVKIYEIEAGVQKAYRIQTPPAFAGSNDTLLNPGGYAPNVWRIVCDRAVLILQGIEVYGYDIRPPKKEELPQINWLAYGSSITNAHLDGYVHVAAANLRQQVQNKGISGGCHIEKVMVDYMLDECESDIMTCELGINMRGSFTPEQFEERASYLIDRLAEMKKPAMIISNYPNGKTPGYASVYGEETRREEAYEEILIELVKKADCKTLCFINGKEILTDICGLRADLLHQTNYGHAVMGLNLAAKLRPFMQENGLV